MITIIFLASFASLAHSGLISHDLGDDDHHKATSYQNIHMEHFHAVPTYVKKEYKHLLEHPISVGKSSSKVEIHHGGKHDHGYAIVATKNNARGSGGHEEGSFGGHEGSSFGGHEDGGLSGGGLEGHEGAGLGGDEGSLSGHDGSAHLTAQAIANAVLSHGGSGYQVHDQNQELLQHHAAQISQDHGALQLQAAAALSAGANHDGLAHYQALEPHQDYEAALANALHLQNGFGGHGHS